ncbi:unnamed protein product [Rotaria socialis]
MTTERSKRYPPSHGIEPCTSCLPGRRINHFTGKGIALRLPIVWEQYDRNTIQKQSTRTFISDMAFVILNGSISSFSKRFYTVALISCILLCLCSYCSSAPFASSVIDVEPLSDDVNDVFNYEDGMKFYIPLQSLSNHLINDHQKKMAASKAHLFRVLLKSLLTESDHRHAQYNDKRYASQSFHAMRG